LIEDLLSRWEDKLGEPRFAAYHPALEDGIRKVKKYYCDFDNKPAFVLSLRKFI
jgi:hypothetical protein